MKRIIITCLTVWVSLVLTSVAFAASGKQGIAILVEGPDAEAVRREVTESIPQGIPVVDSSELSGAIQVRGTVGDGLANPKTRKQTLAAVRKALKQVGLSAALSARSKKVRGGGRDIRVVLIVRAQAEPMIEENIVVGKGGKASAQLSPLLAVPLQDLATSPPPTEKSEPVASAGEKPSKKEAAKKEKEKEKEKEEEDEAPPPTEKDAVATKRGPVTYNNSMVIAEAGVDIGSRQLKYSTVVVGPLRSYLQPGIAAWAVGIQIYPAATQNIPVAKDIGIVARASDSLTFESKTSDGTQTAKGKWTRYAVGVRGRIPIGQAGGPLVGLEGTYGAWKYDFSGTDSVVSDLPAVDYKFVRAGADARVPFGKAAVFLGAGYMNIMSSGAFGDRFPHASIGGVDAKLGASYGLTPWLEARAAFTYARIFSTAKPVAADNFIAGGALDQYFVGSAGVSAIF
jgi:hypothetical protein